MLSTCKVDISDRHTRPKFETSVRGLPGASSAPRSWDPLAVVSGLDMLASTCHVCWHRYALQIIQDLTSLACHRHHTCAHVEISICCWDDDHPNKCEHLGTSPLREDG